MSPFSRLLAAVALAAFPPLVSAQASQINFTATLNGAAMVPPVPTPALGRATFTLDLPTMTLWYHVETTMGAAAASAATLHVAPAGFAAPPFAALAPVAGPFAEWRGVVAAPPLPLLFGAGIYVQISSAVFPAGEIRGQLLRQTYRRLATSITIVGGGPSVGSGRLTLHQPENRLQYWIEVPGFAPPFVGATLSLGGPGVYGPAVAPLFGDGSVLCGMTDPLPAAVVAALLADGCYVAITAPAYPTSPTAPYVGLRGNVGRLPESFAANATGAQETPPNALPATGFATFDPFPGPAGAFAFVAYSASWTGGPALSADVQMGIPGIAGPPFPMLSPLMGPAVGPWIGITVGPPVAVAALAPLFNGSLYFEIDSPALPLGQVRGECLQNPTYFGYCGPDPLGFLSPQHRIFSLDAGLMGPAFGGALAGFTYNVGLTGAMPGAAAFLFFGASNAGTPLDLGLLGIGFDGCVLWSGVDGSVGSAANAFGCVPPVGFAVPAGPALVGEDFFLQWLVVEPGANPLGITSSDALRVTVRT